MSTKRKRISLAEPPDIESSAHSYIATHLCSTDLRVCSVISPNLSLPFCVADIWCELSCRRCASLYLPPIEVFVGGGSSQFLCPWMRYSRWGIGRPPWASRRIGTRLPLACKRGNEASFPKCGQKALPSAKADATFIRKGCVLSTPSGPSIVFTACDVCITK